MPEKTIIGPQVDTKLHDLLRMRQSIWSEDKDLSVRKEANSDAIMHELDLKGHESVSDTQYGVATMVESVRRSLDQDKLKQELLRLGVATGVIAEAILNATKTTPSVFVKYTPVKE